MPRLTLSSVSKTYHEHPVLTDINLDIAPGEFVVFVGPSGCGKSTLLRMIAGLESITGGELAKDGVRLNEVHASRRGVSMVFQNYALYPHMTVYKNLSYGLKIAGASKAEIDRQVKEAARILQIEPYLDRRPGQLSGGQRQRVAIGRALVRNPDLFLFDEPLSNLDASLRVATRVEISRLKESLPDTTMLYVTHDQVEAMTMADRIVVMNGGHIEQVGTPMELYRTPANRFVAGFIGSPGMNFLPAGAVKDPLPGAHSIGIRPEDLIPAVEGDLQGDVLLAEHLGDVTVLYVRLRDGTEIVAKVDAEAGLDRGMQVAFDMPRAKIHGFDESGARIVPDPAPV